MVRINFKGSNIGEGAFDEIEVTDNSEQVAKRNERYIEDLKLSRDAQTAIDAAYIRDAETALRGGSNSQQNENKRKIAAAQTIANQQIKSLQAQAKEIESITGRRANITGKGDKKVDSWLEFVTNTSKKAASIYQDVQEKEAAFQWDQGIARAHMFGATYEDVAWKRRWDDAGIISASKEELAAIAEANGADPSYVDQLRSGNKHFIQATKHALATDMLSQSTSVFQTAMHSDAETIVDIRQADGSTKKVPLNEIDRGDVVQVQQAYYQWLPQHIKENGFGDASPEFLNDGLQKAKSGYDNLIGEIRQDEIQRAKQDRIESSLKVFHSEKTPISLHGAAVAAQNNNPQLTTKGAYESVISGMSDIQAFPDQAEVDALLDSTTVAGGATLRQAYGSSVIKMLDNRVKAQNQRYVANENARQVEEDGEIDALMQSVEADRKDDNKVNQINNAQLEEQAIKAEQEGKTKLASRLRSLQTQTVDGIRQQQLIQTWDGILEDGGYLDPKMIIASGVDEKTQKKYIKAANESITTAVPTESRKFFEKIASKALKNRSGKNYTKDSITSVTVDFATQSAVEQYNLDYAVKLKETNNHQLADEYARERFFAELKNTEGRYKVPDVTADGHPYPQFLPKGTEPVDDITSTFATKFKEEGGAVYKQPHEDLRPSIDASLKTLQYSGKFNYPPAINKIAAMSGGKYNSLDVMRMQAEALGIELPESFNQAQQVQTEIGPAYQKYLNYKPSTTRTDIAAVGSGEDPVYAPTTALGEQVKAIVSKRESPTAGYDAINQGEGGDTPGGATRKFGKPLTEMTVAQVMRLQSPATPWADRLNAVGKYQFIEGTLKQAVREAGIDPNMKFSPAVQDRIFFVHLDNYGLYQPWEQWWISQGGSHLATTAQEKEIIRRFREQYNPADPWRSARNMNPAVVKHQIKSEVGQ